MLGHLGGHPVVEAGAGCRIERLPPQVAGDFPLIVAFGVISGASRQRADGRQLELPTEILQDRWRQVGIGGEEAAVLPQDTELDGKAAEVLLAPMRQDQANILLGQRPIKRQFLVRGMRWEGDGRP